MVLTPTPAPLTNIDRLKTNHLSFNTTTMRINHKQRVIIVGKTKLKIIPDRAEQIMPILIDPEHLTQMLLQQNIRIEINLHIEIALIIVVHQLP